MLALLLQQLILRNALPCPPSAPTMRFLSSIRRPRRPIPSPNTEREPPVATKKSFLKTAHGLSWDDPYHWLSDVNDAAVLHHLQRENSYTDIVMADTCSLQQQLKEEMASRMVGEQTSPPERWGPWLYYARIPEGKDYPVYYRRLHMENNASAIQTLRLNIAKFLGWKQGDLEEQELLDQNKIAEKFGYVHLGTCKISQNQRLLAYTVDLSGNEVFTLFVKDLDTGSLLSKPGIEGVVSVEWARDNRTLLYTTTDHMLRPFRVFKHTLGSSERDVLLLEDKDSSNYVDVARTKDWNYMTININSKTSSEVYLLDAGNPGASLEIVEKRKTGVEYFVEHHRGNLFLLTNSGKSNICNYRLFQCPVGTLSSDYWQQVVPEEQDVATYDMDIYDKHLVLYQRKGGMPRILVLDMPISSNLMANERESPCSYILPLPQGVCTVTPGLNQDFYSSTLRLAVSSPIMPEALLDYNLASLHYRVLQQEEIVATDFSFGSDVVGVSVPDNQISRKIGTEQSNITQESTDGSDWRSVNSDTSTSLVDLSALYVCDHLCVKSVGMVDVPLTIVYSRKHKIDGTNPALLMGYGAYGEILDLRWSSDLFSLLDRGWVLAFAHVRGGGELGKWWHHSGKLLQKLNSMNDFLACADFLIENSYAHRGRLAARGVSAGGLLVAAAVNMRPNLFRAVILKVPFVDTCNTMLDDSLPLTVPEYEEWGNPNSVEMFQYIRSYSPYDNVKKGASYPGMLVSASLLDTRVGYWEAAKWVARVREYTDQNPNLPVLLKTDMNCGHFGEGGRYQHTSETALEYAFLLKMTKD